jgi:hypothetical protein
MVALTDGRTVSVPLRWYPRLAHGTTSQRRAWRLVQRGVGIHWPALDEDVNVEDLLAGRRSAESKASLRQWLKSRERVGRKGTHAASDGRQSSIRSARRD